MPDITAANAVFFLSVPGILPVPTPLQGFAADDVFSVDEVDATELLMGVDGTLSGGMVFNPIPMTIHLQADSGSIALFDAWWSAQIALTSAYPAFGTVSLPNLNKSWVLSTGFLKRYLVMPPAKKLLQPITARIEWQSVTVVPIGAAG